MVMMVNFININLILFFYSCIYIITMTDKNEIIKKVYHDNISGYSSVNNTYKEAKSLEPSITLQDVKNYFAKLPQKQLQFQYKGYNSFTVSNFLDQIQIDIADFTMNAEKNNGFRYALVGVDVFSRYGWAVKMKTKQPHDLIIAFKQIMEVIGKPKSLFSDSEGGLLSNEFVKVLNENNIKHLTAVQKAPYAEVFIRTLKQAIHNRLEGKGSNVDRWIDELEPSLAKYNLTEHSRLPKMSPFEAKQPKNKFEVEFNNISNMKKERLYPLLEVNDQVRVRQKKTTKTKGTDPKWSREIYKVIRKEGTTYMINDPNYSRRKMYLRGELLKV